MTKKDYIRLAEVFKRKKEASVGHNWLYEFAMWRDLANDLADVLQADNPRFNRHKFLVACGIEEE